MNTRPGSLDAIASEIWHELARAAGERGTVHGWRTAVLATTDGTSADARSVILRETDTTTQTLRFFTDARSPKVAQLLSHPIGMLVMWSAALGWQLRCRVHLAIDADEHAVAARWGRVANSPAAQDYRSRKAPGAALAGPADAGLDHAEPSHFAVVVARVAAIDWLELHPDGHRRAVFDATGARWLQA